MNLGSQMNLDLGREVWARDISERKSEAWRWSLVKVFREKRKKS